MGSRNIYRRNPGVLLVTFLCWMPLLINAQQLICENRNPDGPYVPKTEGDGGFQIIVVGPESTKGRYVPNEVYTVTIQGLKTRYSTLKFTEFLLVAESEKQVMMGHTGLITTGIFHIMDDSQSRFSDFCPDGVTNSKLSPKSEISVLWTAPSVLVASCITFKVTLVERPHTWYMDDGQLTKTLCPDSPTPPPPPAEIAMEKPGGVLASHENGRPRSGSDASIPTREQQRSPVSDEPKCCACDDAKYEVVFEGLWSKETHPRDFPENEWLLHFSDIIGASHSKDFYFWQEGQVASEGIRQVAEWGATRHLENELKSKSKSINTIIKARGLWHPNEKGKTSAAFRVDKDHHLMSLVSMIGPSPDWIVGISGFELCLPNCTWIEESDLDLFPYDAGTDSGITYMSPNSPTEPRAEIRAITSTDPDDPKSPFHDRSGKQMKPFARALIRRQRIYPKSCDSPSHTSISSHEVIFSENTEEVNRPECAVTEWTAWSDCSVACGKGLRMRKRSYELPMKADMMRCDRQLVEKEMCLGQVPTCENEADPIEEMDSVCAVSDWSEWTPCSVTCGKGTHRRTRAYKNQLGRKKCNLETIQNKACTGIKPECAPFEQEGEKTDPDCPLTPWSDWSPCSVTCGVGFRERRRLFLIPAEETVPEKCKDITLMQKARCTGEAGANCTIGMAEAKEICMMLVESGPCRASKPRFGFVAEKGMCAPFTYGGCKGNRNRFDTEAECLQVCGFLANTPVPVVAQSPGSAINSLPHVHEQSEPQSATQATRSSPLYKTSTTVQQPIIATSSERPEGKKVDCQITDWSPWSSCSVSCGHGVMTRTRTILAEGQNGGRNCPKRLKRRRTCTMDPCL